MKRLLQNFPICIVFILIKLNIVTSDYDIILKCLSNCDPSTLINPSKPVILNVECRRMCVGVLYEWVLRPDESNVKKYLYTDEVIGQNTLTFIIKRDVLLPKEHYYITVTAAQSRYNIIKKRSIMLHMAKCSRKYPCTEETTAIPPEYIDSTPRTSTSRPKELSQIETDINSLQNMKGDQALAKKKDILSDLRNTPLNNTADVQKTAKMVQEIVSADESHLTPKLVKLTSEVNENIVEAELTIIKKSKQPEALHGEVETLSKTVLKSVPYTIRENISQLSSHREIEETTTNTSIVEQFPFTENYPIYDDYDIVYQGKKENIKIASISALNVAQKLGYANALTMPATKPKDEIITDDACILNIIEKPENLENKYFDLCNARLHLPETLPHKLKSNINKLLITFIVMKKNPFWWNNRNMSSDIISLEIRNDAHEIFSTRIENFIDFYFNTKSVESQGVSGTIKIPINKTSGMYDDVVTVHQIYAKEQISTIVIQFENFNSNTELQVVVTNNSRPSVNDFKYAYTVPLKESKHDKFTIISNIFIRAGTMCYIGVYPTKDTLQKSNMVKDNYYYYNYTLKFSSIACNRWRENNWFDGDCQVGTETTIERVQCRCYHLSSFAVSINDLESRQDSILYIPFELERQYNYIIPITVIVLYGFFFLALICAIIKDRKRFKPGKVLFLMDNNLTYEYKYVIAVYTSSQSNSGTTANIGLQIYGTEGDTNKHVLCGYTVPILRTGSDDWFILLTDASLGELKTLDLWTDCYGTRSSWFCKKVIIYNLQNNSKWIFNVDSWLSVLNNNLYCSVPAETTVSNEDISKWEFAKKSVQEDHLWLSFLKRPKQPAFTFVEKVTVMLSIFLTMMFFIMLFYRIPSTELYYQLDIRQYQIEFQDVGIILGSAVLSFLLHFVFIYIFMNAQPFRPTTLTQPFTYHLSKNWRYIAWFALITIIIITSLVLIIFGLWIGYMTSLLWFTSTILAILLYVFVLESIRVMVSAYLKPEVSLPYIDKDLDMSETNSQKQFLSKRYGDVTMRPLFSKLYSPLSSHSIKIKLEKELSRIELRNIVIDIIMFSIYLLILYCVVLVNKDNMAYYITRNIEKMLIEDKYIREISFHDVNSQRRLYRYLRKTFIPAIYAEEWYENYRTNETGLTIDFNTKLLGIPRIRQIRIQNNTCTISSALHFVVQQCHAEYSNRIQETLDFAPQWKSYNAQTFSSKSNSVWLHKTGWESHSSYIIGELAVYPSGGYIAYFGRTRQNSELVLQYLENTKWIDEFTRAIFIEVCFYNANRNLFNILTLIIEKSATGKYITKYSIRTSKFLFLYSELEISSYITFLLFILMILIFSWKIMKLLRQNTISEFISDVWNVVDLIIVVFAFVFILMSYFRTRAVSNLLKTLESASHNEFVSFNSALYWDDFVNTVATLLVAISTIRIWKLLRFARMFRIFELTLYLAFKYLVAMTFVELLVVFAFSVTGFVLFGPYSSDFRTIFQTVVSLILLGFGYNVTFKYEILDESYASIGYIYYACYMILLLIIVNLFITIIVVAYESAKDYFDENDSEKFLSYNLLNFLTEEFKYFTSKTHGRLIWWHIATPDKINLKSNEYEIKHKLDVTRETITIKSRKMKAMHEIVSTSLNILMSQAELENSRNLKANTGALIDYVLESMLTKKNEDEENRHTDEVFTIIPYQDGYKYCSKRRIDDMLVIVNYLLLSRSASKHVSNKHKLDISSLETMNYMITNLSKRLDEATQIKYSDKNTFVTFEDLGLELIESETSNNNNSNH